MKQFTLKDAAQELGINHETLRAKMKIAGIEPIMDTIDRRRKFITPAQLLQLRNMLRPTPSGQASKNNDLIEQLLARIQQLEERVNTLETSAAAHTPYTQYESSSATHRYQSERVHESLPDGLVSLVDLTKEYGIPETTLKAAVKEGRVPCTIGLWKIGRQYIRYAVTEEQKATILAYFRPNE